MNLPTPEIRLSRCLLRTIRPSDAASIARHANNRNVSRFVRDHFPYPYELAHAEAFINLIGEDQPPRCLGIEVDGEMAGGVGLILGEDIHHRSAEIGYWLGEPYWGQGIATEAVGALVEYGFEQFDLVRVFAEVFDVNRASARVLEKAGFQLEGRLRSAVCKRGQVHDAFLYARIRNSPAGQG
ncbi:MAG TPA: GNAT family protein [Candidatus Limnocylindria bacterium]|nr:GNAT family protein [Candidatus Limnocylindria bacterium]